MQTEIEAKFLNIDIERLRTKLKESGAKCVLPMRIMKRKNFDFPDSRLEDVGGWVRVRDEGDKTTLSYKQLNDRTLHGTKEVSLVIDNFEEACKLLLAIGLTQKSYQETKRESWILGDVQVELDEWPWARPYMEIEAPSEESLKGVVSKLGLSLEYAKHGSVEVVYMEEYDVTEKELDDTPVLTFGEKPKWVETRRK